MKNLGNFFGEKVFFSKFPGRVGGSREYDRAEEEGAPPPHPPPPPSIRKEESEREELVLAIEILESQKFLIDWKLEFLAQNFFSFFLFHLVTA